MMQQVSTGRAKREDIQRLCREKIVTTFCNMHLPKDGSKYPSMELGIHSAGLYFSDML